MLISFQTSLGRLLSFCLKQIEPQKLEKYKAHYEGAALCHQEASRFNTKGEEKRGTPFFVVENLLCLITIVNKYLPDMDSMSGCVLHVLPHVPLQASQQAHKY